MSLLALCLHAGKEQNEAVWMATLVLSRGVAVPVAVHEGKDGWNALPSKLLQAPGGRPPLLSILSVGNELNISDEITVLYLNGIYLFGTAPRS